MQILIELINKGWNIQIYNHAKRSDGDWHRRVCWSADLSNNHLKSEWFGFKYANEAIEDMLSKIQNVENNLVPDVADEEIEDFNLEFDDIANEETKFIETMDSDDLKYK